MKAFKRKDFWRFGGGVFYFKENSDDGLCLKDCPLPGSKVFAYIPLATSAHPGHEDLVGRRYDKGDDDDIYIVYETKDILKLQNIFVNAMKIMQNFESQDLYQQLSITEW